MIWFILVALLAPQVGLIVFVFYANRATLRALRGPTEQVRIDAYLAVLDRRVAVHKTGDRPHGRV
jgi:hypothetical protein